jgi:hypothetical protein
LQHVDLLKEFLDSDINRGKDANFFSSKEQLRDLKSISRLYVDPGFLPLNKII